METFVRKPQLRVLSRIYSIFLKNELKYIILRRWTINHQVFESEGSWARYTKGTAYQEGRIHVGAQIPLQKQLICSLYTQRFHIMSSNKETLKQDWKPVTCEMHGFLRSNNVHYGMSILPRQRFCCSLADDSYVGRCG